jgi:RimJ/RimL family protein N-acetyltransferase
MKRSGSLRRLGSGDRDRVRDHLLRLDGEDRQLRFGAHVSPAQVAAYCAALDPGRTLLLGCLVEGELRAVGELTTLAGAGPRTAEIAISVERRFQGRGIGGALLRRLIVAARNRLFERLYMVCLIDNGWMVRLARRVGSRLEVKQGEVEARIDPPWPTFWTLLEEILGEAHAPGGGRPSAEARSGRATRPGRASTGAGARRRRGGACAGGSSAA